MANDFALQASIEVPENIIPGNTVKLKFTLFNSGTQAFTGLGVDMSLMPAAIEITWPTGVTGLVPVGAWVTGVADYVLGDSDFESEEIVNVVEVDGINAVGTVTKTSTAVANVAVTDCTLDSYLQLDGLMGLYFGTWNNQWNVFAQRHLEIASARVDQLFNSYGFTVTGRINAGKLYRKNLEFTIANMVLGFIAYNVKQGTLQAASVSKSAGDHTISYTYTTTNERTGIYTTSDDRASLGLPQFMVSSSPLYTL